MMKMKLTSICLTWSTSSDVHELQQQKLNLLLNGLSFENSDIYVNNE